MARLALLRSTFWRLLLAAVLTTVACAQGAAPAPLATTEPPPPAVVPDGPTGPLTVSPAATTTATSCSPPRVVAPEMVSTSWPSMIGRRVVLDGVAIVRTLEVATALVRAGREVFVVWMTPDQAWQGQARRAFTVLGATAVHLRGTVTLPELLLVESADGRCAQ